LILYERLSILFISGEKFGDPGMEDPYDWDSLSARVRRQRRQGHRTLMQRQKGRYSKNSKNKKIAYLAHAKERVGQKLHNYYIIKMKYILNE
jgi:hypothetical protein